MNMNARSLLFPAILFLSLAAQSNVHADVTACGRNDTDCQEFTALSQSGRFDAIIQKASPKRSYSDASRDLIGKAYLAMADREGTAPEQKETYYRNAIAYGAYSAYMGLYAIQVKTDAVKAHELLKQYIAAGPEDPAPYVVLGEAAFKNGEHKIAREYLKEGKKVAHGKKTNLDWLLFKASYITEEYGTASTSLDSSFSQGKTVGDLKALVASDPRFATLGKRSEFRKFFKILNGTATPKTIARN